MMMSTTTFMSVFMAMTFVIFTMFVFTAAFMTFFVVVAMAVTITFGFRVKIQNAVSPSHHSRFGIANNTRENLDTAGSLCGAAKALVEIGGAKDIYACASHGVLSGPAIERIENSCIKELLLLDTIPYPENAPKCDKIHYLPVGPVFAEAMERIHEETSIASLFD